MVGKHLKLLGCKMRGYERTKCSRRLPKHKIDWRVKRDKNEHRYPGVVQLCKSIAGLFRHAHEGVVNCAQQETYRCSKQKHQENHLMAQLSIVKMIVDSPYCCPCKENEGCEVGDDVPRFIMHAEEAFEAL